eukprot:TRINITY_DN20361_c0_g1_i1.p1 TRINITY_DN20361_c0_g1~~TRINITY_DN20361_c0_g1_i1.p1  ORF type:complete len:462 (+),score=103.27 TRINITY_DN20361_c0_g1_i1:80-1465(+)
MLSIGAGGWARAARVRLQGRAATSAAPGRGTAHGWGAGVGRHRWPALPDDEEVRVWTDGEASTYLARYTPLVQALFDSPGRAGNVTQRTPLLRRMTHDLHRLEQAGVAGAMAYTAYVEAMCRGGVVGRVVRGVPTKLRGRGLTPSRRVYNALLQGLAVHGRVQDVWAARCEMRADGVAPDVFTYNALMTCFVQRRQWEAVLRVFAVMKHEGVGANDLTYDRVLASCPGLPAAKQVLEHMRRAGANLKPSHFVSMFAACRRDVDVAQRVPTAVRVMDMVRALKVGPTGQHYDALMAAYKEDGDFARVEAVMHDRVKDGLDLSPVTYTLYIAACAGAVTNGEAAAVANAEKCFHHAVGHGLQGYARLYVEMLRVYTAARDLPKATLLTASLHGSLQHVAQTAAYQLLLRRLYLDLGLSQKAASVEAALAVRWAALGLSRRQIVQRLASAPLHHSREVSRVAGS